MHYNCPDCKAPIGLMANKIGDAETFECPRSRRKQPKQTPIKRETRQRPKELEVNSRSKIKAVVVIEND